MKIRSEKHRKYIASQSCIITGRSGDDIHPHHLLRVESTKGMGTKACDMWCIPLHYTIHDALHKNGNEEVFFLNHGLAYGEVKELAHKFAFSSPCLKIKNAARNLEVDNDGAI